MILPVPRKAEFFYRSLGEKTLETYSSSKKPPEVLLTCMESQCKDRGSNLDTPTVFSLLGLTIYWRSDQALITKMVTTVQTILFHALRERGRKKTPSDYISLY